MRKTIGLIAGGFKPLTRGHWSIIELASQECDVVKLVVSTKDRARPGELPILWAQMKLVWDEFILSALPSNVEVILSPAPIKDIMDILNAANKDENNYDSYFIYSDPEDTAANFPQRAKNAYMSRLIKNDQVVFRSTDRAKRPGGAMSGTMVRKFLAHGDLKQFIAALPGPIRLYGPEIYRILGGKSPS